MASKMSVVTRRGEVVDADAQVAVDQAVPEMPVLVPQRQVGAECLANIVLYRAAYPPGWSWNFDRYSWTGSPGIRCGMPQSMVAPTKKASTYVITFLVK